MRSSDPRASQIDLKRLRYFVAMADAGSISAAASALGIAQPTLSENISALEARLQTKLAIRGTRGAVLTEAGQELAGRGKALIEMADALADDVRRLGSDLRGAVSVGLPPSLSMLLSVPLAETVYSELPDIQLRVVEGLSGSVLDWVGDGAVTFGFVYELPDPALFDAVPIMEEDLFLLAAADDVPHAVGSSVPPEIPFAALGDLPLVMPSRPHGSRRVIERIARATGVTLRFVSEIDSLTQIVEMVGRASAYAIVPHAGVVGPVASGDLVLVRIVDPVCRRTAYRVRRRAHGVTAAELAVERTLLAIVREVAARFDLKARLIASG